VDGYHTYWLSGRVLNLFICDEHLHSEIGNESLHRISNDNGVRVMNFATLKNLIVKSTMFPHRNIHKFTWTSPDGRTLKLTLF
jgi:hypothetical protein